ncbi:MAG: phospholipase A, partial [SAR324 cluster bacterium]|nr:phospholipase A [SAR324 cluster bacterium]
MLLWAWGQTAAEPLVETYKQNFFLTTVDRLDHEDNRQNDEVKFQISFKKRLFEPIPLYVGYTQKSFWQIYSDSSSRPFRENNFNPEGFFDFNLGKTG